MSKKPQSKTIKLQYPIEWASDDGEKLVSEVVLKRPKGKHIKSLGKDLGMGDIFKIASKVSGFTPAFFDELDAADCLAITEVIGDFLDNGQATGKTHSP